MLTRTFRTPLLLAVLGLGTTIGLMVGGCPQVQVPNTSGQTDNDNSTSDSSGGSNNGTSDEVPRPIPPVVVDETTTTGGSSVPVDNTGSGGGDGSGSGGGSAGASAVVILTPSDDLRLRPGSFVTISYELVDATGAVTANELLLARDNDSDGVPDGAPVQVKAISKDAGVGSYNYNTSDANAFLSNGFGRFVFGLRTTQQDGTVDEVYAPGTVTIDAAAPTGIWLIPNEDSLLAQDTIWPIQLTTEDNSSHTVRIVLDADLIPANGNEFELIGSTTFGSGTGTRSFSPSLATIPTGTFNYYVELSDGIDPTTAFYVNNAATGGTLKLAITTRLIGAFDLNQLSDSPRGAILQGFNPNDLAGSALTGVPDIDGDGDDEMIIVSRFGKPYNITTNPSGTNPVGFGEAYMVYGSSSTLRGIHPLNAVGSGNVSGLAFAGIRTPINVLPGNASVGWTAGISDVTVVPDMDGDGLPELVFSFPRVESICLGQAATAVAHPDLVPDGSIGGIGTLEYDAYYGLFPVWHSNEAQFARGGVVIVSSSNNILTNPNVTNRKDDRVFDLHEAGQVFTSMSRPGIVPYINSDFSPVLVEAGMADCDDNPDDTEHAYVTYGLIWDTVFDNQSPGGFHQSYTVPSASPPLAQVASFPFAMVPPWIAYNYEHCVPGMLPTDPPCDPCADFDFDGEADECHWLDAWIDWSAIYGVFPCTTLSGIGAWNNGGATVWTGFYQPSNAPQAHSVGARVLGQAVNDQFGTSVGSDGTFLYIAARKRTANGSPYTTDVPLLSGSRAGSGVVYQMRTDAKPNGSQYTLTQLWIEPGQVWPNVDAQLTGRSDTSIPVPHQYIVESVGSSRLGGDGDNNYNFFYDQECPLPFLGEDELSGPFGGLQAPNCIAPSQYPVGTAGYYMDRVAQIVGPHVNSELAFVRGLGDFDGDGIKDVAIGSERIKADDGGAFNGAEVGGIFLISSRSTGLGGDLLLDDFQKSPGQRQLAGVMLRGSSAGEKLARVFDAAGDFDNDGLDDIVVGNEGSDGAGVDAGEVILILGAPDLNSPAGGWTIDDMVNQGRAIRFRGAAAGDLAGSNVAGVGDFDGDGKDDIMIAAPGAESGKGAVYLIYGSNSLSGELSLADIGKIQLPGVKFVGRVVGDGVGAGSKIVTNTDPGNGSTTAYSRGMTRLGDLNNDGLADLAISAIGADPIGRTDAGEVYILYGKQGQ